MNDLETTKKILKIKGIQDKQGKFFVSQCGHFRVIFEFGKLELDHFKQPSHLFPMVDLEGNDNMKGYTRC